MVKKIFVYMVIEVGLVLLSIVGFAVGPLLLWPRWSFSSFAQIGLVGGVITSAALVTTSVAYAVSGQRPSRRGYAWLRLAAPFLMLVLALLYFLPVLDLPPIDPASKPLLIFGPTDEVQMLVWTTYTVFIFVPVALASLFWHVFTIVLVKAYWRRHPATEQAIESAAQPQTAAEG